MKLAGAAALVAVAAVTVAAAQAGPAPIRVQGFAKIGTFNVSGGGPAQARRAFGKPTSQRETASDCTLVWPGLQISFYTLLHDRQCRDWSAFGSAKITGPWVTDRGLHRGDPVSRAKQLYPDARKPGRSLGIYPGVGLLIKFAAAIGDYGLAARVSEGRVTTLFVEDPQGGE